jgi:hypothetical protein
MKRIKYKANRQISSLRSLVVMKLIDLNADGFTVEDKDGERFHFVFDEGGCCGYNEIKTTLSVSTKNPPVITKVQYQDVTAGDEDAIVITFFGLDREIAKIFSMSSSDSGWAYGATVAVKCREINFTEVITQY